MRKNIYKRVIALTAAGAVAFWGVNHSLADGTNGSDSTNTSAQTVTGTQSSGAPDGAPGGTPPSGAPDGTQGGTPPSGAPDGMQGGGPGGTPPDGGQGGAPGGGPGGSSSSSVSYSGATEVTSAQTLENGTYTSETADQNSLLINTSEAVTVTNPTVQKSGDSDGGDNCNFYGINSGIMVKGGASATITGGTITTSAQGANGVFSYGGNGGRNGAEGDGTTVTISDTKITTTGNNAGGIMTTGGGKTIAKNLTIDTSGNSSAPIRTDRGGGTVEATGGTYTSNGTGSPAIYSTADITVSDAVLTSNASEGVCIEGKNSITLKNCTLTASNNKLNGNAQFYDTIMMYQSQSGDAADGTSVFTMTGGTLNSKNGDVFHVTNTTAVINLSKVSIVNGDSDKVLISVCDDGWSGADNIATLNAADQTLEGTVLVGSDSTLNLNLSGTTSFVGKTSGEISNDKGTSISTSIGTVNVTMSDSAVWTLTGDSVVTSLSGTGKINYNGYTLTVGSTKYTSGSPAAGITETTETPSVEQGNSSGQETTDNGTVENGTTDNGTTESETTDSAKLKSVSFKNISKTIKYTKVKKTKVSYSVIQKSGSGKVTYKVTKGKKKYISVSKTGVVTVKKGAKKGTYKVLVTVAAKGEYQKTTKEIMIVVK